MHISDKNNYSDFISVSSPNTASNILFLIDTEAKISLIKRSKIPQSMVLNTNEKILLKGITSERIESMGTVKIILVFHHISIEFKLHVVGDAFDIPSHGILGKDFLRQNNCNIDYGKMALTVSPNGVTPAEIPIRSEILRNLSVLPPRSETFKLFRISSNTFPCIIETQDVTTNVCVPTTIVHAPETWIRVLNTNETSTYIQTNKLKPSPLTDFEIFTCYSSEPKRDDERQSKLKHALKNKIPSHAKELLMPLCNHFNDIFHLEGDKPTTNNFYTQKLHLRDHEPVYVKNYRLPQTQKLEIRKQVQKLLDDDLIELSTSNYNSPLIIVPKKSSDGKPKWRMCVDYRLLNKKLIPDKHPLPRIDEILDGLGRARYFSVMDLHSGYHQIRLDDKSKPLTSFSTDGGFYQFKVLPFGISIAPASFTRMMTIAFAG